MKERLKEIVEYLDCDIYWKNCNFLDEDVLEDENIVEFYSRDLCKNISFKELLLWYLPRIYHWQDSPNCEDCDKVACNNYFNCSNCEEYINDKKVRELHEQLYMELIDIYVFYNSQDSKKHKALIDKLRNVLNEEI